MFCVHCMKHLHFLIFLQHVHISGTYDELVGFNLILSFFVVCFVDISILLLNKFALKSSVCLYVYRSVSSSVSIFGWWWVRRPRFFFWVWVCNLMQQRWATIAGVICIHISVSISYFNFIVTVHFIHFA